MVFERKKKSEISCDKIKVNVPSATAKAVQYTSGVYFRAIPCFCGHNLGQHEKVNYLTCLDFATATGVRKRGKNVRFIRDELRK